MEVPTNIQIVYLPPYSPELNPVERVFQDIKKHLKNKVFNVIEELEDTVCEIVKSFTHQRLKKLRECPPKCVKIKPKGGWTHEKEI
ncbi:transposase [Desulfurobacterium crinifex]